MYFATRNQIVSRIFHPAAASIRRPAICIRLFNATNHIYHHSTNKFCTISPMKRQINTNITLNETENKIRSLLVEFCDEYNKRLVASASDAPDLLELRITGGWVRDKLLGNESNDLDIAINHLSGEEFATKLFDYASSKYPDLILKSVHTIKKNPEKSKHLETCTTKLFGLDIDFVNLRSEAYTEDSRVPIIQCGTAEEDALRRDATLNALFYNLNKSTIEDFTGKGLDDLQNGILRTPLQPLQTFLDDPLRVLRLIRFAARFNFIVEEHTLEAMINEDIKSTLIHKISRERVGVEAEKILTSSNPQYGLRLINYVGLTDSIFNAGNLSTTIATANTQEVLHALDNSAKDVCEIIDKSTRFLPPFQIAFHESQKGSLTFPNISAQLETLASNKQIQKLFWLAVILLPFRDLRVRTNPKKPNTQSITEVILKEGLRFGKNDFETVATIIRMQVEEYPLLERFFDEPNSVARSELGLYLKECGNYTGLNLLFNCIYDLLRNSSSLNASKYSLSDATENAAPLPVAQVSPIELSSGDITILKNYESLFTAIQHLGLENIHTTLKPIVDGKTLLKTLDRKPGPWLGKINEQVLVWQLDNPTGTPDECIEFVKSILPKYT